MFMQVFIERVRRYPEGKGYVNSFFLFSTEILLFSHPDDRMCFRRYHFRSATLKLTA
jgi:hypothetical protein